MLQLQLQCSNDAVVVEETDLYISNQCHVAVPDV